MTSRLSLTPSQSVQLHVVGQQLGLAQGPGTTVQLNAIRSGAGYYWNGLDLTTSGQRGNMSRFQGVNIYTCQTGQTSVSTTGTASVWLQGQYTSTLPISAQPGGTVYLRNDQQVVGNGGSGGSGGEPNGGVPINGGDGQPGSPAIQTQSGTVYVYNYGNIYGGGGGGGGGGGYAYKTKRYTGGGGGGGAISGSGGPSVGPRPGQAGQSGTPTGGGAGGAGYLPPSSGNGGAGGQFGQPGSSGQPGTRGLGGAGGTAGGSITGATTVTWTVAGNHN